MSGKKKILVVDDEQEIIDLLSIELEQEGYEIISALDGNQGLELARDKVPDLIILDVMIPNLDGYQICRILKFDKQYESIPIILLTAREQKTDKDTADKIKADLFLTKPFNGPELIEHIKILIAKKEMDEKAE